MMDGEMHSAHNGKNIYIVFFFFFILWHVCKVLLPIHEYEKGLSRFHPKCQWVSPHDQTDDAFPFDEEKKDNHKII